MIPVLLSISGSTLIANQSAFDNLTIQQGRSYLFRRGETFRVSSTININQSNVRFGAYDSGNDPIFTCLTAITGWTDEGAGIYSKTMTEPGWVHLNGSPMKCAETDWIESTSRPGLNQIGCAHADVSGFSDISGSGVIYKERKWKAEGYDVLSYNGAGAITLTKDIRSSFVVDSGFKLTKKQEYFSGDNEWAYEGGTLYIKVASDPSGLDITQNASTDLIEVAGDNFTIENIDLSGFFRNAIYVNDANALSVSRCKIHEGRGLGVCVIGWQESISITNSEIYNCGFGGVYVSEIHVPVVTGNEVYNIGMMDNFGYTLDPDIVPPASNTAILIASDNETPTYSDGGTIDNNKTYNVAYCGFKIEGKNNSVRYNIVYDCMQRFADGGGIYSFGGNLNADDVDAENNTYEYNIIRDCPGGLDGYFGPALFRPSAGIYLDNESISNSVNYNVIINCSSGIVCNRATKDNSLLSNIIVGCELRAIEFLSGISADLYPVNEGNVVNDNIIAAWLGSAYCFVAHIEESDPDYNPYANGGGADGNYYINPYSATVASDENAGNLTFAQLKTLYGQDVNSVSKTNWLTYVNEATAEEHVKLYTNETDEDIQVIIPAGYEDVDGVDVSGQQLTVSSRLNGRPGLLVLKTTD